MKLQTPSATATTIDIAHEKAQYDTNAKKLLSNVEFLSRLLQHVVEEFKDMDLEEIKKCIIDPAIGTERIDEGLTNPSILGETQESTISGEGYVTFDIRFSARAERNERGKVLVNIELQQKMSISYPVVSRGIFYCARMLSSQKTKEFFHSEYDKIKKTYSIWLIFSKNKEQEPSITRFHMKQQNVYGNLPPMKGSDLLEVILICIPKDVLQYDKSSLDSLIRMFGILFSTDIPLKEKKLYLENDYDIPMTEEMERGLDDVCNLSEAIEEQGIEKGIKKGIQQGIEQGIAKGRIELIRNALKNGLPEDVILKVLGVSEDDIRRAKL